METAGAAGLRRVTGFVFIKDGANLIHERGLMVQFGEAKENEWLCPHVFPTLYLCVCV